MHQIDSMDNGTREKRGADIFFGDDAIRCSILTIPKHG
jgi:hypothetical protein